MAQTLRKLEDAGYVLAEEIRDGRWKHVTDLARKPAPACAELIDELRRRCPGFTAEEYQRALGDGLFASR
ncbi:hypothetical protein [Prosthecobacter sp.]|uniref:hypothetical protein n=1 Tax=Prosthecobacter sp. TaxID=1965333 RepID=UPI0037844092